MADLFRKAGEIWGKADRAVGGWLPGGGYGSPLTQYVKRRPTFVPGERTLEGDIAGAFNTAAGVAAKSRSVVKNAVQNSPDFVKDTLSSGLNQLPASVNLFGRYYTGLGDRGLQFSQQYKDKLFGLVEEADKNQPVRLSGLKQEEKAMTEFSKMPADPSYYKPTNDMLAEIRSDIKNMESGKIQFKSRAGRKDDTDALGGYGTSLGSAWFTKTPDGGYTTDERYDFMYAGDDKKYPIPYGPFSKGAQMPTPSEGFAYGAAQTLLGRQPKFMTGKGGSSPEANFGRAVVAKLDSDPFNYTLKLNRPQ